MIHLDHLDLLSRQDQGGVVLKEDPFKKLLEAKLGCLHIEMSRWNLGIAAKYQFEWWTSELIFRNWGYTAWQSQVQKKWGTSQHVDWNLRSQKCLMGKSTGHPRICLVKAMVSSGCSQPFMLGTSPAVHSWVLGWSQEQGAHDGKGFDAIPAGHEPWLKLPPNRDPCQSFRDDFLQKWGVFKGYVLVWEMGLQKTMRKFTEPKFNIKDVGTLCWKNVINKQQHDLLLCPDLDLGEWLFTSNLRRGILRNNGATPSNATYLGGINMLMSDHMEQMREVMGEAWLYIWLVVWNINFIFPYIGFLIIPIDFHIFRGVAQTPTSICLNTIAPKKRGEMGWNGMKWGCVPNLGTSQWGSVHHCSSVISKYLTNCMTKPYLRRQQLVEKTACDHLMPWPSETKEVDWQSAF